MSWCINGIELVKGLSFDFSGEEAVENAGDIVIKVAFDVARDLNNGESIKDTISKKYDHSSIPKLQLY